MDLLPIRPHRSDFGHVVWVRLRKPGLHHGPGLPSALSAGRYLSQPEAPTSSLELLHKLSKTLGHGVGRPQGLGNGSHSLPNSLVQLQELGKKVTRRTGHLLCMTTCEHTYRHYSVNRLPRRTLFSKFVQALTEYATSKPLILLHGVRQP